MPFRIKICGVRRKSDVLAAAQAGADAIGLNFYPPSPRSLIPGQEPCITLANQASELGLVKVGLFVDVTASEMSWVAAEHDLHALQLHGNETPQRAEEAIQIGLPVVRAVKLPLGPLTSDQIAAATRPWWSIGCHVLLDADGGSHHGGTGQTLDWAAIGRWAATAGREWTLAGGLTPENVGEAIRTTGAVSVDVSSGVESQRGIKDANRIGDFVASSGLAGKV